MRKHISINRKNCTYLKNEKIPLETFFPFLREIIEAIIIRKTLRREITEITHELTNKSRVIISTE
jgi:hypothetical protein